MTKYSGTCHPVPVSKRRCRRCRKVFFVIFAKSGGWCVCEECREKEAHNSRMTNKYGFSGFQVDAVETHSAADALEAAEAACAYANSVTWLLQGEREHFEWLWKSRRPCSTCGGTGFMFEIGVFWCIKRPCTNCRRIR